MKSVLISIQPKWVEKIASGKKTIEVRKTRPKIETPFKCYIYCTEGDALAYPCINYPKFDIHRVNNGTLKGRQMTKKEREQSDYLYANGKVIGEFVCDRVDERWFYISTDGVPITDIEKDFEALCCLKRKEIINYALQPNKAVKVHNGTMFIYGWHITDLKIYDKPKELSEFYRHDNTYDNAFGWAFEDREKKVPLKRPPQSWQFIETGE